MDIPSSADEAKAMLRCVLDGIELMSIDERTKLITWADNMRVLGMWAVPGMERGGPGDLDKAISGFSA
jgi:hypothetical protein